jgi:pimeloyl-ACP methyl ester carboxylesterase
MGEGQPLLLIHGFGASIGHWRKNIPVLAAAGYQVFAIDLLGFGKSGKPALDYSLELWKLLVKDFWQEKIQKPTVFVGNSIGALLALMVVADYPEISAGAVLLNAAGGMNHSPKQLNYPLRWIMAAFTRLLKSPITGQFLFNRIRQKHRIRKTLAQVYCNPDAITEELVEMLYQPSCDAGAQKVFASVVTAPSGRSTRDLLPLVECPLLVLWGEADPWTPIKAAKIYQDYSETKNIQLVPIANTGHCPHDENPDVVNPLIVNWLSEIKF